MLNVFCQSALNIGGSCHEFEQAVYINATGMGAANVKDRKGAQVRGAGHRGGVCMALSMEWMSVKGNWDGFLSKIVSPLGQAEVRGYMNLSKEADNTGGYKSWEHRLVIFTEFLKVLGMNYRGQKWATDNGAVNGVPAFVKGNPGFYYCAFWWADGGHAIAFENAGDTFKIFDPNYGEVTLPAASFDVMAQWVLGTVYYSAKTTWAVQQYQ